MHFTRRLLERRTQAAFIILVCVAGLAGAASCSSTEADPERDGIAVDGGPDSSGSTGDAAPNVPVRDAAPFDGGPLPVVCESAPCATALVTTRGGRASDRGEGFCALLQDGTVACWGAGGAGQLGRGDDAGTTDSATPARVVGLHDIVSLDHTCAVDATGAAYCWGTGPFLRDPLAATTTERTPVKLAIAPATKVAVGASVGCALVENGVVCWGANQRGQVAPFETASFSAVLAARRIDVPSGAPFRDLVVGDATFAIRTDGTVVSWGANPPLGRESSLFPDPYPMPAAVHDITTLDVAENNACATSGGVAYCWGTVIQDPNQLVYKVPPLSRARPTPVATPEPVVQIATTPAIEFAKPQRWCACAASGSVYCWGDNQGGQAGDGTKEYATAPVKVKGLPGPAAAVRTTTEATCALLTSGKVYCWGTNFYGQLGSGNIREPSLTPQEVVLP
ncbi:MAG: hypothetical protein BGO98_22570 [Myxococcales bacterium 68-20]|nr:MAG: hypothetical protein BGO98_22570 [Myxococcales bacterium 68-20]